MIYKNGIDHAEIVLQITIQKKNINWALIKYF